MYNDCVQNALTASVSNLVHVANSGTKCHTWLKRDHMCYESVLGSVIRKGRGANTGCLPGHHTYLLFMALSSTAPDA